MTQDRLELVDSNEIFAKPLLAEGTKHVLVCDFGMSSLRRMWCLFEILRSREHNKELIISPLEAIQNASGRFLRAHTIQLSKASCTSDHDRLYIEKEIKKVTLAEMNKMVEESVQGAFERAVEDTR